MAARKRTRSERASAKRQSLIVESFNDYENRLERERYHSAAPVNPVIRERRAFYATMKLLGYLFWWRISSHYVELSRHTEVGTSMTAVVMRHIAC